MSPKINRPSTGEDEPALVSRHEAITRLALAAADLDEITAKTRELIERSRQLLEESESQVARLCADDEVKQIG